jgi:hypothetical protein
MKRNLLSIPWGKSIKLSLQTGIPWSPSSGSDYTSLRLPLNDALGTKNALSGEVAIACHLGA